MTSWLPPSREKIEKSRQVQKLIDEQINNTLGNEVRSTKKIQDKVNNYLDSFTQKALMSGKYNAAAQYSNYLKKPRGFSIFGRDRLPKNIVNKAKKQLDTIRMRANTAIRRNMKKELTALDKFDKRRNLFEHSLRVKHDPFYTTRQMNRDTQRDLAERQAFSNWAKLNDPRFYKQQQSFIKKYGDDPARTSSFYTRPTNRDLRDKEVSSRKYMNRYDYDQALRASKSKYSAFRKKQQSKQPVRTLQDMFRDIHNLPKHSKLKAALPSLLNRPVSANQSQNNLNKSYVQYKNSNAAQIAAQQQLFDNMSKLNAEKYKQKSQIKKPKKYNQASYLAGLQQAPMTMGQKMNQGIAKPYANGGGVRKPKYNKKG